MRATKPQPPRILIPRDRADELEQRISATVREELERGLQPVLEHLAAVRDLGRDPLIDDTERGRLLREMWPAPEQAKAPAR